MSKKEMLARIVDEMPETRVQQVLDFAMFLQEREDHAQWQMFGQLEFARAYGDDEPEYTIDDIKTSGES